MDGNTRLCTATAAAALKETFGTDGQPGSYTDVDHCDAIALWGHNVAETQTVLWMRMLDRLRGPDPPRAARRRPAHDAGRRARPTCTSPSAAGTNLALMNGLLRELIERRLDRRARTSPRTRIGFDELARDRRRRTRPSGSPDVCDVAGGATSRRPPSSSARASALLSTVLQGFYQSHQATAAACQVNNLHLLRGMIGRPGAGVLQMNGQPTAQNTRETGADGDLPGLPQLGQPGAHRASSPSCGTSTR